MSQNTDYEDGDYDDDIDDLFKGVDDDEFYESSSATQGKETGQKFLCNLNLDILMRLDKEELERTALELPSLECLEKVPLDVFRVLLDSLRPTTIANVTSKDMDILHRLRLEQLQEFAMRKEVVLASDPVVVVNIINACPEVVALVDIEAVEKFAGNPEFVMNISDSAIEFLMKDDAFAHTIVSLNKTLVAKVVTVRPQIIAMLPTDDEYFPTKSYVTYLMEDPKFLSLIPYTTHVYLAESKFRKRLTEETALQVIMLHPTLPLSLTVDGIVGNKKYFTTESFLEKIPCRILVRISSSMRLVDRLPTSHLSSLARSSRVWSCMPVQAIRRLMKESHIGQKISFANVKAAAKTMSKAKSLDRRVVLNMMRYQIPDMMTWDNFIELFN